MHRALLLLIGGIFFTISLITNVLGPIVPDLIRGFHLRLSLAGLLPFSFFLAYGLCSIPAGMLVERWREKRVVVLAFALVLAGSASFALLRTYRAAIGSLFVIGIGMALLQVAINPLLRVVGGEARFAFHSVIGQLIFGLASFLAPWLYGAFAARGPLAWISLYWLFAALAAVMLVAVALARFPEVRRTDEEASAPLASYRRLLARPVVLVYFLAIFSYVGLEQGVATWMSQYLHVRHGLDPQREGAQAVAWFWGLMTAGCALGLYLLQRLDSRTVLAGACALAIVLLGLALTGGPALSRWCFSLVGFAASVMWSIVFSLALNSLPEHHGAFSGILCTAIVGGAFVPYAIGLLGDHLGLRAAMLLVLLPLGYLLAVARWARPLIANERVA